MTDTGHTARAWTIVDRLAHDRSWSQQIEHNRARAMSDAGLAAITTFDEIVHEHR